GVDARTALADWMTTADNKYFARAAVNRLWAHFFGIGLVEPVDELGEDNAASHPELLKELTKKFAAHGFDLHFLVKAITASKAYQLSGAAATGTDDPRLFARMAPRGLTGEHLYDSLAEVMGTQSLETATLRGQAGRTASPAAREQFLSRFAGQGRGADAELSILQALHLMNGGLMSDATNPERNPSLKR